MKQVSRNDHFTILLDERRGLIHTIRSDKPFSSLEELEVAFGELGATLDGLGRARYALLCDIRAAPGRNDPQFEAALQRVRPRWISGFRRVGVLVKSVVGQLQIQRYARQDGIKRLITNDEDELLKYLTQED
ncbi:hypothetical protein [Archangium sp.]|uniref:hypothetical protein n=1 Tax=Archangium sp. TaxID=1872627 RepID=UPI002EDAC1C5